MGVLDRPLPGPGQRHLPDGPLPLPRPYHPGTRAPRDLELSLYVTAKWIRQAEWIKVANKIFFKHC